MASGLMIILINKATKLSHEFLRLPKEYKATIRFGIETDTLDIEGNIISEKDISGLNIENINEVLTGFIGKIKQVPPMYSALKHNGKPLYKIARSGISVERKSRDIEITGIKVIDFDGCQLTVKVGCSSGTYIRTLASDIGKALKTGAALSVLERTKIGSFSLDQSVRLKKLLNIAEMDNMAEESNMIIGIEELLINNPSIYIKEIFEKAVKNGKRIRVDMIDSGKTDISGLCRSLENDSTCFGRIVPVKSSSGEVLAVHFMISEIAPDNKESFKQEFTKSIVIF